MGRRRTRWSVGERFALLLTNATKAAGLVIAVRQGLFVAHRDAVTMGVAVVMMAGAQATENVLIGLISALFGLPTPKPTPAEEPAESIEKREAQ